MLFSIEKQELIDILKAKKIYFGEDAIIVQLRNAVKSVIGENKNKTVATNLAKTIETEEDPTKETIPGSEIKTLDSV